MAFKLKVRTLFPALVSTTSPLTLLKVGLAYTFGLDITALRASLDALYTAVNFTQTGTGAVPYSYSEKVAQILSVKDFGAKGDGVTDDYAKIIVARDAARTLGKTLAFPDGTYLHSQTIEWGYNRLKVISLGANAVLKHTGTGVAHSFNGIGNYPASQGCAGGVFGGPNRFLLEGNANTTNLVLVDNWHFGDMKIAGKNCTNAVVLGQDSGIVGACAVETVFDIQISTNVSGAFTTIPLYGVNLTKAAACKFPHLIIESVGNVTSSSPGLLMAGCIGNIFEGGTVESCLAGGVIVSTGCKRNTFINLDVESNGTSQDWVNVGNNNTFIGCSGAGTTSGQYFAGNYNRYVTCMFQSAVVIAGATENIFENCMFLTAFTDNGTRTTVISPDSLATAVLSRPNVIGGTATALTKFGVRSTGSGAFDLVLKNIENLTAERAITFGCIDADRTVRFAGDVLFGGAAQLPAIVVGDVWYGSSAGVMSALAGVATGNALISGGVSTPPAWGKIGIGTHVSGLGTGVAAFLATPSSANLAVALTDEDGTGVLPFEATGTWTPTDQSGGGVTFTAVNCRYTKIGNIVHAYGVFTFSSTASGAAILIGGLPFTVANASYGALPSAIKNTAGVTGAVAVPVLNTANFNIFNNGTNANVLNSALTLNTVTVNITYPVA